MYWEPEQCRTHIPTLVRLAISKLLKTISKRVDINTLLSNLLNLDYNTRAKPKINWEIACERNKLLNKLHQDALQVIEATGKLELKHMHLLAEINPQSA
ncbi:MAG: hypothetical protein WC601_01390 [Desulfotomaculaceae bacterium]